MLNQASSRTMVIITFLLATLCLNSKPYDKYEDMLNDLKNLSIDESKVFKVENFIIKKADATFNFKSGNFYLCKPINGRYMFAIFEGTGNFRFKPNNIFEINQIKRILKKDSINITTNQILFFFTDNFADSIEQVGVKINYENNFKRKSQVIIKDFFEYEFDKEQYKTNNLIIKSILNDVSNKAFYSFIKSTESKDLFFQINPDDLEESELLRGDFTAFHSFNEIICKYHIKMDENIDLNDDYPISKKNSHINNYKINVLFNDNLNIAVTTKCELTGINNSEPWISLYLYGNLDVKCIDLSDTLPLEFYQSKINSILWVKLPRDRGLKDTTILTLEYEGAIFSNSGQMFSSISWYPSIEGKRRKTFFEINYTTPLKYKLASVGELCLKEIRGNNFITKWTTTYPIRNASFSIDEFSEKELKTNGYQDIELLYIKNNELFLAAPDLAYSIEFFSGLLGRISPNKLYISEEPGYINEAFPGLIHISESAFYFLGANGRYEHICTHEIAHQWWGVGIDFESYHDQWLSEGLAEYSSLIYLQGKYKDNNETFFGYLNQYKINLIKVRTSFLGKPIPAGPISLGYRNNSSKTRGDFGVVVYQKGAWIFHMIRNLLLDLKTMKDDKFFNMMKEFYQENVGKTVSTKTFQEKVESTLNMEMDWFFNQWIHGYKIPKYKFAYHTEKTEDGNYKISCRVEQSEVDPDFQMYVPIKIDFGDKKVYRIRKLITGTKSEFNLPLFADKPIEVIFNDLESVLCEVDNVGW